MQLALIPGLPVAIAAVAFALQNNVPATATLFLRRLDSAPAMVLPFALAFGALIVARFSTSAVMRLQWQVSRLRKQVAAPEHANGALKAQVSQLGTGAAQRGQETKSALARMASRRPWRLRDRAMRSSGLTGPGRPDIFAQIYSPCNTVLRRMAAGDCSCTR